MLPRDTGVRDGKWSPPVYGWHLRTESSSLHSVLLLLKWSRREQLSSSVWLRGCMWWVSLERTSTAGMHFRLADGHRRKREVRNGKDGGAVKDHSTFSKYPHLPKPLLHRVSPPPLLWALTNEMWAKWQGPPQRIELKRHQLSLWKILISTERKTCPRVPLPLQFGPQNETHGTDLNLTHSLKQKLLLYRRPRTEKKNVYCCMPLRFCGYFFTQKDL